MSAEPGTRLLEEIVLLLDAVAERLGPMLDRVAAEHDGPPDNCPLCAVTALMRGEPNELAAASLDRAADIVALLRAVLADRPTSPTGPPRYCQDALSYWPTKPLIGSPVYCISPEKTPSRSSASRKPSSMMVAALV